MSRREVVYSILWFVLTGVAINLLSQALTEEDQLFSVMAWLALAVAGIILTYYARSSAQSNRFHNHLKQIWQKRYAKNEIGSQYINYIEVNGEPIVPELLLFKSEKYPVVICKIENPEMVEELFARIEQPVTDQIIEKNEPRVALFPNVLPLRAVLRQDEDIDSCITRTILDIVKSTGNDYTSTQLVKKIKQSGRRILLLADTSAISEARLALWLKGMDELPAYLFQLILAVPDRPAEMVFERAGVLLQVKAVRYPLAIIETEKMIKKRILQLEESAAGQNIQRRMEQFAIQFSRAELANPGISRFRARDLGIEDASNMLYLLGNWIRMLNEDRLLATYEWNPLYKSEKDLLIALGIFEMDIQDDQYLKEINDSLLFIYVRIMMDLDTRFYNHPLKKFPLTEAHQLLAPIFSDYPNADTEQSAIELIRKGHFEFLYKRDQAKVLAIVLRMDRPDVPLPKWHKLSPEEKTELVFNDHVSGNALAEAVEHWFTTTELLNYFDNGYHIPASALEKKNTGVEQTLIALAVMSALAVDGPLPTQPEIVLLKKALLNKFDFQSILASDYFRNLETHKFSKRVTVIAGFLGTLGDEWRSRCAGTLSGLA